jgi:excisionase family DNA binding protein
MSSKTVKASEAAKYYGISIPNLRKWAREGTIPAEQTPGGHYNYIIPVTPDWSEDKPVNGDWTPNVIYCRVSSRKQEDDLERQVKYLSKLYPDYTIIRDIGSGINYKRKGFQTLLERLFKGDIKKVVVAHQDRFVRFGFDFFQWLFIQFGAILETVERPNANTHEDLVGDIMEIFTVFTARYYGRRKYDPKPEEKESEEERREQSSGTERPKRGRPRKQRTTNDIKEVSNLSVNESETLIS